MKTASDTLDSESAATFRYAEGLRDYILRPIELFRTYDRGNLTPDVVAGLTVAAVFVQLASVWGLVSRLLGWGVSWKDRKV